MTQENPPAGDPPEGTPPPAGQGDPDDRAELKEALAKERQLARDAQKALKDAQAERDALAKEKQERELAEKSELERAIARAEAAEQAAEQQRARAKTALTKARIHAAAVAGNAVDPDDVYRLLDLDALTYNDDGEPIDADKAVESLLKAKPHLVKAQETNGHRGTPPSPKPGQKPTNAQLIEEGKAKVAGIYTM